MGGGLMQLVAYGAQDIYLTGNPQITFFKVVYRRHTNFSMEAIQQGWNGGGTTADAAATLTATISRNGDLVHRMWLDCDLVYEANPAGTGGTYLNWTNNTGHALIEECSIEIGGQRMEKHTGQWLDIWNELTDHEESEWLGLNKHAAKNAYLKSKIIATSVTETLDLYVPLKFWFCRNPGLALPLIALQYHEIKFNLKTRSINALVNGALTSDPVTATNTITTNLWVDYIYLDTDERRRFAQVSHEYLIEQVQISTNNLTATQSLNFNHPVKEIFWVTPTVESARAASDFTSDKIDPIANVGDVPGTTSKNDYFNYSVLTGNPENISGQTSYTTFGSALLKLNGHERFQSRKACYFRLCQPQQSGHKVPTKHIYSYSFALKPEEHQPSGTCNFSRIDNAKLILGEITTPANPTLYKLNVYAINYNVLRIMSGMGGLAYSN